MKTKLSGAQESLPERENKRHHVNRQRVWSYRGAGAYRKGEIKLGKHEDAEEVVNQILKDGDNWSKYRFHYRGEKGGEVACVF